MKWVSKLWSLFFGGGTIVGAVDDGLKLADDLAQGSNAKAERDAGAAEQVIASDKATQKTIDSVNAPVTQSDVDRLWDQYAATSGADK